MSLPAIPSSVPSSFQIRKASRGQEPIEPFVVPDADGAAATGQRAGMMPGRPQKTGEASTTETTRSEAGRADPGAAKDAKGEDPGTPGDAAAFAAPAVVVPQPLPETALQAVAMPAPAVQGDASTEVAGDADASAPLAGLRSGDAPQRPADIIALQAGLVAEEASATGGAAIDKNAAPKAGGAVETLPTDGGEAPVRTRTGRPEEFPGRIGLGAARAAEAGQGRALGNPWTRAAAPPATPENAAVSGKGEPQPLPQGQVPVVQPPAAQPPAAQAPATQDPGRPTAPEVAGSQAIGAADPDSGAGPKQPMADAVADAGSGANSVVGKPGASGYAASGAATDASAAVVLKFVDAAGAETEPSDLKIAKSPQGEGSAGAGPVSAGPVSSGSVSAGPVGAGPVGSGAVAEIRPGELKQQEQAPHHERAGRQERAAPVDAPQPPSQPRGDEREANARPEAAPVPNLAVEPPSGKDGAAPAGPLAPLPRHAELPAPQPHPGAAHQMAELPRPVPPSALPIEIGLRALQGAREFQIRLDPAELGKVEVRLEISEDKTVTARVVVDRVETLHLLQRDAKTLERAFEQAGLKTGDGGVDISLRDHAQQGRDGRSEREAQGDRRERGGAAPAEPAIDPRLAPLIRRAAHRGALDLTI